MGYHGEEACQTRSLTLYIGPEINKRENVFKLLLFVGWGEVKGKQIEKQWQTMTSHYAISGDLAGVFGQNIFSSLLPQPMVIPPTARGIYGNMCAPLIVRSWRGPWKCVCSCVWVKQVRYTA